MLSYPVRLVETGEGKARVIFFDVPEAVAEARTESEAIYQAKFALELSLGNYVMHGRAIPAPSDVRDAPTVSTDKFSLDNVERADEWADGIPAYAAPGGGRY